MTNGVCCGKFHRGVVDQVAAIPADNNLGRRSQVESFGDSLTSHNLGDFKLVNAQSSEQLCLSQESGLAVFTVTMSIRSEASWRTVGRLRTKTSRCCQQPDLQVLSSRFTPAGLDRTAPPELSYTFTGATPVLRGQPIPRSNVDHYRVVRCLTLMSTLRRDLAGFDWMATCLSPYGEKTGPHTGHKTRPVGVTRG